MQLIKMPLNPVHPGKMRYNFSQGEKHVGECEGCEVCWSFLSNYSTIACFSFMILNSGAIVHDTVVAWLNNY